MSDRGRAGAEGQRRACARSHVLLRTAVSQTSPFATRRPAASRIVNESQVAPSIPNSESRVPQRGFRNSCFDRPPTRAPDAKFAINIASLYITAYLCITQWHCLRGVCGGAGGVLCAAFVTDSCCTYLLRGLLVLTLVRCPRRLLDSTHLRATRYVSS